MRGVNKTGSDFYGGIKYNKKKTTATMMLCGPHNVPFG